MSNDSHVSATVSKFKVGDRVQFLSDDTDPGTVVDIDDQAVSVRWDFGGNLSTFNFRRLRKFPDAQPAPPKKFKVGDRVTHKHNAEEVGEVTDFDADGDPIVEFVGEVPTAYLAHDVTLAPPATPIEMGLPSSTVIGIALASGNKGEVPAGAGPGEKDDSGKIRFDLVPTMFVRGVARVLTYGAFQRPRDDGRRGYGKNNWQGVDDAKGRYFAAMMRHLHAWRAGETKDVESGLNHLWHAATNLAFLVSFEDGHDPVL